MQKTWTALCLILTTAAAAVAAPVRTAPPLLATPDQIEGERLLRETETDPAVRRARESVKAILRASAIGGTKDGAARIDEVTRQWTRSLIVRELLVGRTTPVILWGTDDTPRTWLGYTLGGVGTSGDNPDHIYRSSQIDGAGRYEITGRFDPATRPAQFVLSVAKVQDVAAQKPSRNQADLGAQIALLSDRDIRVTANGSFRVTLGGDAGVPGGNHVALVPGPISVGFRDVLSDWSQRPARLTIRRLDPVATEPFDPAALRRRVVANLAPYVRFWSAFPASWMGGLAPNSISDVRPREGGWGYLAGIRFALKADEAILVTTGHGGARYAGIQITDPWMIAVDGRRHQTSINSAQARADASGDYSYVIAARDPGVANWLDTGGLHDGMAVLRWQNVPQGTRGQDLLRGFRVIKIAEAAGLPGVARITPAGRRAQIAARAAGYAARTR